MEPLVYRHLEKIILSDLEKMPAVVLFGPRQAGKTTLAKQLATSAGKYVYLDMELPSDRSKLSDTELYLSPLADSTVILDEVQLMPQISRAKGADRCRQKTRTVSAAWLSIA